MGKRSSADAHLRGFGIQLKSSSDSMGTTAGAPTRTKPSPAEDMRQTQEAKAHARAVANTPLKPTQLPPPKPTRRRPIQRPKRGSGY